MHSTCMYVCRQGAFIDDVFVGLWHLMDLSLSAKLIPIAFTSIDLCTHACHSFSKLLQNVCAQLHCMFEDSLKTVISTCTFVFCGMKLSVFFFTQRTISSH